MYQQTKINTQVQFSQTLTSHYFDQSTQTLCANGNVQNAQDFLMKFLDFLKLNNQENDFMALASGLMENTIDKDNIAWLAALHRGRYSKCKTTCNMKYDTEYVEFFSLFYILFGASALNILDLDILDLLYPETTENCVTVENICQV